MKTHGILAVLLLALTVMACSTSLLGQPSSPITPTPGIRPTSLLPATDQPPASPMPAVSRHGEVCFAEAIVDGKLRVRACPGLGCQTAGFLDGGTQVAFSGDRKAVGGSTWLYLVSPIAGWVNIRYVCENPEATAGMTDAPR